MAQNFAIVPDGVVHLEYEVAGTIPDPTPAHWRHRRRRRATPVGDRTDHPTTDHRARRQRRRHRDDSAPRSAELTLLVTALEPITLRSEVSEVLEGGRRSAIDSAEYDLVDVLGAEQNGTTSSRRPLILDVQTVDQRRGEERAGIAAGRPLPGQRRDPSGQAHAGRARHVHRAAGDA